MHTKELSIPGCLEIRPVVRRDSRGNFVKVFQREAFERMGLETAFTEDFYSNSVKGVLRGLHFQIPPFEHAKLVYCLAGEVLDAVLDLRVGSPMYGKHELIRISSAEANSLYIPPGLAHGFLTLSDNATMAYKISLSYSPAHDSGVRWNSAGIAWPINSPRVSVRDADLPLFGEFDSPFVFGNGSPP